MYYLDFIGAVLALSSTYFFTQAHLKAWLLSIVAILTNAVLYYQKGIYAHAYLEIIYLLTSIYGWYYWQATPRKQRTIGHIPGRYLIQLLWIALVTIPLLAYWLKTYLHSEIAYWDASTTILALMAQWMLARKWLECWGLWFVVDALVAALHFQRDIPFHSLTHVLYLGLAIVGYRKWRQLYLTETNLKHKLGAAY
jgi:nicotinamide mononucleotide transporter